MHNSRVFKVLILVSVSLTFLVGFEEKFSEKNQTGSPVVKQPVFKKVPTLEPVAELNEETIVFESGPETEDRRKFEGWYEKLQSQLLEKKGIIERLELLQQGLVKLEKDRVQLQNLNFNEEIDIDFLIKPLKILPRASEFRSEDCPEYKMKILSHFDPTSENDVKDPSLIKALTVFKLICTN